MTNEAKPVDNQAPCPNGRCPHPAGDHGVDNPGGTSLTLVCCHDCPCGWETKPGDIVAEGPDFRMTDAGNGYVRQEGKPVDLEAIRARHAAATRGPWRWWDSCSFRRLSSDATGKDGDVLRAIVHFDCVADVVASEADKAFLAASWKDVADLLAEVDHLRATVSAAGMEGK